MVIYHGKSKITSCSPQSTRWMGRQKGSGERASNHFDTKLSAVEKAREISRNQGSEFYIHGMDGKIQQKDSYGNDPCPPKDKN